MQAAPDLPRQYELVTVGDGRSVVEEAVRRAWHGAEEGLLVWEQHQGAADKHWHGLHAALLLRPERPTDEALELVLVGVVSLGLAVAESLPPMVELRYRWPGDLLLDGEHAGGVAARYAISALGQLQWLVLDCSLEGGTGLGDPPDAGETAEPLPGEPTLRPPVLLEQFSRHFLSWVNRWEAQGSEPLSKVWLQRAEGRGEQVSIGLADGRSARGVFAGLDERCGLVLEGEGEEQRIALGDCWSADHSAPP